MTAMVKLMIGRDLKAQVAERRGARRARSPCACAACSTAAYPGKPVDLDLRRGEILGLAGLVGAGRTELARALFGIEPAAWRHARAGRQAAAPRLGGRCRRGAASSWCRRTARLTGLVLDLSIAENISLPNLPRACAAPARLARRARARRRERAEGRSRHPRGRRLTTPTGSLSGGNQQKVVLAKWLAMKPKVMIFDEPTRGIDIGAKAEIYRLMRRLADAGVAVLMISSDMEEVIGVSDRIAVMHEGRIAGILDTRPSSARRTSCCSPSASSCKYAETTCDEQERSRPSHPDPGGRRRRRGASIRASCCRSTSPIPPTSSACSASRRSARPSSSSPAASSCRSAR